MHAVSYFRLLWGRFVRWWCIRILRNWPCRSPRLRWSVLVLSFGHSPSIPHIKRYRILDGTWRGYQWVLWSVRARPKELRQAPKGILATLLGSRGRRLLWIICAAFDSRKNASICTRKSGGSRYLGENDHESSQDSGRTWNSPNTRLRCKTEVAAVLRRALVQVLTSCMLLFPWGLRQWRRTFAASWPTREAVLLHRDELHDDTYWLSYGEGTEKAHEPVPSGSWSLLVEISLRQKAAYEVPMLRVREDIQQSELSQTPPAKRACQRTAVSLWDMRQRVC